MKIKILSAVILFIAAPLIVPLTANATNINWTFYDIGANGATLGSPLNVPSSPGSYDITLTAITDYTTGATGSFYEKNLGAGSDEQGLGVLPGDEVSGLQAIEINLPSISGLANVNLLFNSLAGDELAQVWSGIPFGGGTSLGTITHNGNTNIPESFAIPAAYIGSDLYVTASTKDFLLYGANATTPTPEPSTLLLLGFGLAGFGSMKLRRNKKSEEDTTAELQ